jgi:predicted anti-sigma-YlaC factor YlaD
MTSIWQRIRGRSEPGLTCAQVVELVTDYLEGGLTEADRARFEAHLSGCDGCTNYLDQIRVTIAVVGHVHEDDLSAEARAGLLAAFQGWARDE